MRPLLCLLAGLCVTAQASEQSPADLPDDIVKHESRLMAAGICKKRGYQFIDSAGTTRRYWLCLHTNAVAPNAVRVEDVLMEVQRPTK